MFILYSLLGLMLVVALSLLVVPFASTIKNNLTSIIILVAATIIFSVALYQISSNQTALKQWLTQGKQHYQLQIKVQQLGGIDGIIQRVSNKLALNPNDAQGWFILGKMYLLKQKNLEAKNAFTKAHDLAPQDKEINKFYIQAKP